MSDALLRHCITVYSELKSLAEQETLPDKGKVLVFRGSLAQVFSNTNISRSYYKAIFELLEDCGSLIFLQKGTRGLDTVALLIRDPIAEDVPEDLTGLSKPATVTAQKISDIEKLLGGMNVQVAIGELQTQLNKLKKELQQVKLEVKSLKKESNTDGKAAKAKPSRVKL